MTAYGLEQFIDDAEAATRDNADPADCVTAIAPLMHRLLDGDTQFLEAKHFRDDPDHYARNAVHIADGDGLSLYTLVWNPGQWTPVHDHGSWGVVGVVQGVLEEHNFIRLDHDNPSDAGIKLVRGGPILLSPGTVTTFVPNPDHIHKTGVSDSRTQTVSLHLYGRTMNSFHTYDTDAGTRQRIDVFHNES